MRSLLAWVYRRIKSIGKRSPAQPPIGPHPAPVMPGEVQLLRSLRKPEWWSGPRAGRSPSSGSGLADPHGRQGARHHGRHGRPEAPPRSAGGAGAPRGAPEPGRQGFWPPVKDPVLRRRRLPSRNSCSSGSCQPFPHVQKRLAASTSASTPRSRGSHRALRTAPRRFGRL